MEGLALPKFIAIKSVYQGGYASYSNMLPSRIIQCIESNIVSPSVKMAIERAKINSTYVHLRVCNSNKYWVRTGQSAVAGTSDQPEEDTSKSSCTLFEPSFRNGFLYLTHVHTGLSVISNALTPMDPESCLVVANTYPGDEYFQPDAFTYVDWDTLIIMPKHVAFKGDNGKFLKSVKIEGHEYLQFSSDDFNEAATAYEVSMSNDGHLRIWSNFFGKFWRRSPNWIWADSSDTAGKDIDTLFWPAKASDVSQDTIAIRNAGNNNFCKRLTTEGKTDCLNAAVTTITTESRLQVVELVFEREIYDVTFNMADARIFDERVFIAGNGSAKNDSPNEYSKLTVTVLYEDTSSYTFSNSLSIMAGVKTSITSGLPFIAEGKVEISAEVTNSLEWNRTTTKTKSASAAYQVRVPPMAEVKVNYVATEGTCNIPFSYTQRDRRSSDGNFIFTTNKDGVYTGANYYNFQFDNVEFSAV